ncbi:putative amino-acid permease [Lachnellula hyalina]|uniref:Putative amino-acid permease n=1 Tax=Lachnellula hyalina TaxID=1316788 RepID=A0A8H8TVS7_9HELO|nr:putative amino-acid permease [Lachnellula hyalina]TVY23697.1 putative amino-acid permease [Lachnellula hyalina]
MASQDEKSPVATTSTSSATGGKSHQFHEMATIQDDDERLLAQIGYNQDMSRHFNQWSILSYAVSVLGVLGSVPATYGTPLSLGGPAAAVWAWFIGSIMASFTSASVSELVSAYPTAGGMYFVTKSVVPPEHAALWAWVIGWLNLLGQGAGVASVSYTISQMIFAGASMNSKYDSVMGAYAYTPYKISLSIQLLITLLTSIRTPLQIVLLTIVFLVFFGVICSLTTKKLHEIELWFGPINILGSLAICIALLALTPDKQNAKWVFGHFIDGSGWGTGFSFLLSFLSVAWVMTDYDSTTHMSEETHDAATRGPRAIRWSVTITGIVGWLMTITFCFCIDDLDAVVKSPTGLPAAQIFLNAGGRKGGTAMWFFVILVQAFTGASAMMAMTRMTYAFARDGAIPFSRFFSKINQHTRTPVNAVWLCVGFCSCMTLIGIGSTLTIVAIFNITAPALDFSYALVILARNIYANRIQFVPGPYQLGLWQKPINAITCTWVFFISIVLLFPTIRPITALNMNYASAVAAFIAVFSLGWWFAGARRTYTGPRTKELLIQVNNEEGSAGEEGVEEDNVSS